MKPGVGYTILRVGRSRPSGDSFFRMIDMEAASITRPALTDLMAAALDLGERLLICGGEVSRVEDTIGRLCRAYGADQVDVFTITSSIIVTARFPQSGTFTQIRRISGVRFNLTALKALNDLSRRACATRMPPYELRESLRRIDAMPRYGMGAQLGIWALISASFSLFFGGGWLDAVVSAGIGVLLCLAQAGLARLEVNSYFSTVLCSLLGGLLSNLVFSAIPQVNPTMVNIGNIMLLIPGIALTNAIRDVFSGDTMSGLLRTCEALFLSMAIAWGFAVTAAPSEAGTVVPVWLQITAALFGTLAFSMHFNVRGRLLLGCTLGGGVSWGVVALCVALGLGEWTGYFFASLFLTVYAQIMARAQRSPATVFIITAAIPMIPGGSLYNTMRYAMAEDWNLFVAQGIRTVVYAILISAGILCITTLVNAHQVTKRRRALGKTARG